MLWFQGQIFSGKDHRVYLLGNPILFWAALVLKAIFLICYTVHEVKKKRKVKVHPALSGEIDNWFFTPSQPRRSYQGDFYLSGVKCRLAAI